MKLIQEPNHELFYFFDFLYEFYNFYFFCMNLITLLVFLQDSYQSLLPPPPCPFTSTAIYNITLASISITVFKLTKDQQIAWILFTDWN